MTPYVAAVRLLETTSLYEIRLVYSGSRRIALQIRHEHLQQIREAGGNPLCQLTAVGHYGEYPLDVVVGLVEEELQWQGHKAALNGRKTQKPGIYTEDTRLN